MIINLCQKKEGKSSEKKIGDSQKRNQTETLSDSHPKIKFSFFFSLFFQIILNIAVFFNKKYG
jgi:hypothetical protein